jgi:hypothetical protein
MSTNPSNTNIMSAKPKYNCKQVELYSIAKIGLGSFIENKAAFESFKANYGDPYAQRFEERITSTMGLPGFQVRDMRSEVAGIQLREAAQRCLDNWQALRRYIRDVKSWANLQKPKLEAAGSKEYPTAARFNWEYVLLLNDMASSFIEQFGDDLKMDGNMPDTFAQAFNDHKERYKAHYLRLMDAAQDNPQDTRAKIMANNDLYDELMRMFEDGQFLFRSDSTLKNRFIFARVLNRVRRPSGGGSPTPVPVPGDGVGKMAGTVVRSDTGMPLAGAEVTIAALGLVAVTDADGRFELAGVPVGTHPVMAWHAEMESLEKEVTVVADAGVTVDFSLRPLGE